MLNDILGYLAENPPGAWVYPLLSGIAFVETLFPPVPGDLLFIAVSGWAASAEASVAGHALAGLAGCTAASCLIFYLGHKPGQQLVEGWLKRKVPPERIDRSRELISRRGPVILAASRFIPGIRSLLVLIAGSSGMGFSRAAFPIVLSAAAWYSILSLAGSVLGRNLEKAQGFLKGFQLWTWVVLGIAAAVILAVIHRRRRQMQ